MLQKNGNSILIIGAESSIGSALSREFLLHEELVYQTSRRKDRITKQCSYLDLSEDITHWELPHESINVAILCAGITSLETCEREPLISRRVNVVNTIVLVHKLIRAGVFVIFPSSSLVFDGKQPLAHQDGSVHPLSEYGRQKVAVEKELYTFIDQIAIVRFSKIISTEVQLIRGWISDLKKGASIYPFHDMFFSPVSLKYAVLVLKRIADRKFSGITQVSANKDISYEAFARYLAKAFGVAQGLVVPISYREKKIAFSPRCTSMDCSRLLELGFQSPHPIYALRDWQ